MSHMNPTGFVARTTYYLSVRNIGIILQAFIVICGSVSYASAEYFGLQYEITDLLADIAEIRGGGPNVTIRLSTPSFNEAIKMKYFAFYCDEENRDLVGKNLQFCGRESPYRHARLTTFHLWLPSTSYSLTIVPSNLIGFREFDKRAFEFGTVRTTCDRSCYETSGHLDRVNVSMHTQELENATLIEIRLPPLTQSCPVTFSYDVDISVDYVSKNGDNGYIIFRNTRLTRFRLKLPSENDEKTLVRLKGAVHCKRGHQFEFFATNGPLEKERDPNGYIDALLRVMKTKYAPLKDLDGTIYQVDVVDVEIKKWYTESFYRVDNANYSLEYLKPDGLILTVNATFILKGIYVELWWWYYLLGGSSNPTAESIEYAISLESNSTHVRLVHIEQTELVGVQVGVVSPGISQLPGASYVGSESFPGRVRPMLEAVGAYMVEHVLNRVDIHRYFDLESEPIEPEKVTTSSEKSTSSKEHTSVTPA